MMITAIILVVMVVAAGAKFLHIIPIGIAGIAAAGMYAFSTDFRRKRLLMFMDPWQDPLGNGWQIIQSLYAISSGGLFGVGLRPRCTKIYVHIRTT